MHPPVTAYLSLGGNIDPGRWLPRAAQELLARFPGARFSPLYRSPAVGFEGEDFLNAAAEIHTDLSPEALIDALHGIEEQLGRRRDGPKFSARTIDIDLVLYADLVQNAPGRTRLPRPEVHDTAHVLKPILDLAPSARDPENGHPLSDLLQPMDLSGLHCIESAKWWA